MCVGCVGTSKAFLGQAKFQTVGTSSLENARVGRLARHCNAARAVIGDNHCGPPDAQPPLFCTACHVSAVVFDRLRADLQSHLHLAASCESLAAILFEAETLSHKVYDLVPCLAAAWQLGLARPKRRYLRVQGPCFFFLGPCRASQMQFWTFLGLVFGALQCPHSCLWVSLLASVSEICAARPL